VSRFSARLVPFRTAGIMSRFSARLVALRTAGIVSRFSARLVPFRTAGIMSRLSARLVTLRTARIMSRLLARLVPLRAARIMSRFSARLVPGKLSTPGGQVGDELFQIHGSASCLVRTKLQIQTAVKIEPRYGPAAIDAYLESEAAATNLRFH
jgi:hypothetical protein